MLTVESRPSASLKCPQMKQRTRGKRQRKKFPAEEGGGGGGEGACLLALRPI